MWPYKSQTASYDCLSQVPRKLGHPSKSSSSQRTVVYSSVFIDRVTYCAMEEDLFLSIKAHLRKPSPQTTVAWDMEPKGTQPQIQFAGDLATRLFAASLGILHCHIHSSIIAFVVALCLIYASEWDFAMEYSCHRSHIDYHNDRRAWLLCQPCTIWAWLTIQFQ